MRQEILERSWRRDIADVQRLICVRIFSPIAIENPANVPSTERHRTGRYARMLHFVLVANSEEPSNAPPAHSQDGGGSSSRPVHHRALLATMDLGGSLLVEEEITQRLGDIDPSISPPTKT